MKTLRFDVEVLCIPYNLNLLQLSNSRFRLCPCRMDVTLRYNNTAMTRQLP